MQAPRPTIRRGRVEELGRSDDHEMMTVCLTPARGPVNSRTSRLLHPSTVTPFRTKARRSVIYIHTACRTRTGCPVWRRGLAMAEAKVSSTEVRARVVLVIEDDAQIRRAVRNALRDTVDRVVEAATASEGIDLAAAEHPELVILDLGLPDMPGIDVCREIRGWATMPIVVLSARHAEEEKVRLLNAGADDYITRPFSVLEFKARVLAQLRRARTPGGPFGQTLVTSDGLAIDFARRTVSATASRRRRSGACGARRSARRARG